MQNILKNTNILLSCCCIFYMFLLKLRLINEFLLDYIYGRLSWYFWMLVFLYVIVSLIFIIIICTFFQWRVSCFGQTPDRGFCTTNKGSFLEFYCLNFLQQFKTCLFPFRRHTQKCILISPVMRVMILSVFWFTALASLLYRIWAEGLVYTWDQE